jgi:caffeoyl-CoA O-methyltransferase
MIVSPDVEAYAEANTTPLPQAAAALLEEARDALPYPEMLSGPVVGRLLQTLVWGLAPQLVVEVGTYAGFSALVMAAALPPGGRLITCEISDEHAAFARRHFEASELGDRIDLRVGPASETLEAIDEPVGFAFIDADKPGYVDYYEALVPKLAPRGLIAADNTLRGGRVLDGGDAMNAFNDHVMADARTVSVLLPVRDGVTLARLTD